MSSRRQILLLSSSKVHGHEYLDYAKDEINTLLRKNNVSKITFVPYALRDHQEYLEKVQPVFVKWGYEIEGIHNSEDPVKAAEQAQAFYVGGGNTFQLLKTLYDNNLISIIRNRCLQQGVPYIGSSAGTNIATLNICTTNDMPIVYPPSFDALKLVPFNINPHYMDCDPSSTHMGETREERINQYHEIPGAPAVVGLREGSMMLIEGEKAVLKGLVGAKVFYAHHEAVEYNVESDLSTLLHQ